MTNFQNRLLLTLTCLPLIFASLFLPMSNHIIIIVIYGIVAMFFGSYEFNSLIYKKGINVRRGFIPTINSVIYIFAFCYSQNYFDIIHNKFTWAIFVIIILGVFMFIYGRDVFKKDLTHSLEKMAYSLLGIIYIGIPSFFLPFLFNITSEPVADGVPIFTNVATHGTMTGSLLAVFFVVLVWGNDIFAYVFGIIFGQKHPIGLTASPKKSWIGYIGGYFSTFFFVALYYLMFNTDIIPLPFCGNFINFDWWFFFGMPILTGVIVPIGDLAESVIKRSANVKDSGNSILGRGGILDSVDTILYLMPAYFMLIQLYLLIKF